MSEQDVLPREVHPEAALLPWYVNGTLKDEERQQVAQHVEVCTLCRNELEELMSIRTSLKVIYESQPGPSEQTARSVLASVGQQGSRKGTKGTRRPDQKPALGFIDEWLRSFFMPRWVPTLVALLLVSQAGILLWLTAPAPDTGEVSTRSLAMQTARIQLSFQSATTAEQIRSLLQSLPARLIDGPTENGEYTIEVLAVDKAAANKKLEVLRSRSDVVHSAQLLTP